jgi:hypothetical protein
VAWFACRDEADWYAAVSLSTAYDHRTHTSSAGKPNPLTFPFESITLNLKPPLASTSTDSDIPLHLTIDGQDLDDALQYGPSAGLNTFRGWLETLQAEVHGREKGDWTVTLGSGSQDLMTKVRGSAGRRGIGADWQGIHFRVEPWRPGSARDAALRWCSSCSARLEGRDGW